MEQVTRDHSLLQEQLDSGLITPEEAKLSQNKNLVTRALGIDPTVEPEIHVYETQPDDIFLLCSDGLSDMVDDEEIRLTLITLEDEPQPHRAAARAGRERQRRPRQHLGDADPRRASPSACRAAGSRASRHFSGNSAKDKRPWPS